MSDRYHVVFEGEVVSGKHVEAVKKELMRMLKVDEQGVDRLFAGRSVIVRKNVDAGTAEKYQDAFYAAGAICKLQAADGEGSESDGGQQGENDGNAGRRPAISSAAKTVATAVRNGVILTNIETVPGKEIVEHFGLVSGSTIRAKHVGRDIMAGFKNHVGG
jgi:hypothetical protein